MPISRSLISIVALAGLFACSTGGQNGSASSSSSGSGTSGSGGGSSSTGSGGDSGTNASVTVTTVAGDGTDGYRDGSGSSARFGNPTGVAVDAHGNLYVADAANQRIRKIDPSGAVSTLAGESSFGFTDGPPLADGGAQFNEPEAVAVDGQGNVYVADTQNDAIRKVDPTGFTTTLAGDQFPGDGDGAGSAAEFSNPEGIAVDAQGNVYVADTDNNRIRKIDPSGNVTTLAGNGTRGFADGTGGRSGTAEFSGPIGVTVDASGNVYVGDTGNERVRKIDPSGNVTTLAGNGDGSPTETPIFIEPTGVAVDASGKIYVADTSVGRIDVIDSTGKVNRFAGNIQGFADGTGAADSAMFGGPRQLAIDASGTLYVADPYTYRIRKVVP